MYYQSRLKTDDQLAGPHGWRPPPRKRASAKNHLPRLISYIRARSYPLTSLACFFITPSSPCPPVCTRPDPFFLSFRLPGSLSHHLFFLELLSDTLVRQKLSYESSDRLLMSGDLLNILSPSAVKAGSIPSDSLEPRPFRRHAPTAKTAL